jgi:integrase
MKGSIDKYTIKGSSKPRWRYRLYIGKAANGVKQWESHGGYEKQGDAAVAMRLRIDELRLHRGQAVPITFGEHLRQWLDQHAPQRCTPKTLERYHQLSSYVLKNDSLALTSLRDITAAQMETSLYALLKAPGTRKKHLSAKTVRHVAGVMNVALNKAFRLGLIDVNPMLRVELPAIEKHDARSLTPKEIDALLDACLDDWTHPFVQVAMATGCRRGELLALEWPDVDLKTGTILVSKSLEQTRDGLRVKRPKSGPVSYFSTSEERSNSPQVSTGNPARPSANVRVRLQEQQVGILPICRRPSRSRLG